MAPALTIGEWSPLCRTGGTVMSVSCTIPGMTRPLPEPLPSTPFSRRDAVRAGVSSGRLRNKDVVHPFRGVQATALPSTVVERCRAYAVRMRAGEFFTHVTAAQLHGLPLPVQAENDERVHVGALHPAGAPIGRGVVGHRLRVPPRLVDRDGLPVAAGADAWCQLAPQLSLDDLIVIADALLTRLGSDARAELEAAAGRPRRPAGGRLRRALVEARVGSRSPGETRLRLLLVRGGIPEPELNAPIVGSRRRLLGHGDLVWRRQRVVAEYEGDLHRTDREQFRYDIERYEQFRDAGWTVVRVTGDDLQGGRRSALVQRMRRRLVSDTEAGG
jgi:hypothetical protein